MSYKIRKLTLKDYIQFKRLEKRLYKSEKEHGIVETADWDHFKGSFITDNTITFGAFKGRRLIGSVRFAYDDPFIYCLYVDGAFRRQGVASALINECINYYKKVTPEEDRVNIELNVYTYNENAIKLYENLGFEKSAIVYSIKTK